MRLPCEPNGCPMDALLKLLNGPWTTSVIWILDDAGALRFGALKRQIAGVSTRMLTVRLRLLEEEGLVTRNVGEGRILEVSYALTPRGRELCAALRSLNIVAQRWRAEDQIAA